MPAPFTPEGALDLESLESLTEFLIGRGVDGLVVLGVMGEAPKLSQQEQDAVITTTVRTAAGRVPVYVGSGAAGTDLAVERSRSALGLGAAGLLVAPPPVQELERGSDGMMTGFSYPEVLLQIYRAFTAGDVTRAKELFYGACPILRYEFQPGIGLALRKEVYRQRGAIRSATVRHPGAQIDDRLRAELADALRHSGLGEGVSA